MATAESNTYEHGWWRGPADVKNWGKIYFSPWWTDEFKNLEYVNEQFNNPEDVQYWRSLGYTQTTFTGDQHDMRFDQPKWVKPFERYLPLKHFSWSIYRMRPGSTLPEHSDTYARFRKIYNISDTTSIRRYIVFLENWASGHYLEIDSEPIQQWLAGTAVFWHDNVPHLAANVGKTDRYTLQITGVIDLEQPIWKFQHANNSFF